MDKIAHLSLFCTDKFVKLKGKYTTKINKSRAIKSNFFFLNIMIVVYMARSNLEAFCHKNKKQSQKKLQNCP